ncbi:MAG: succinate dehydrogenase assembly factor 2, partial [Burkholderiaceae bacterium]
AENSVSPPHGRSEGGLTSRSAGMARSVKGAPSIAQSDLQVARRRLRWRARRGLLENDLILSRFLQRHGDKLTSAEMLSIEALLDLPENELLDVLLERAELPAALKDDGVHAMLDRLRSA